MSETTPRIRWHDEPETGEAMGCAGTLDQAVFRIWAPEEDGGEWMLTAAMLPGYLGRRSHGDGPGEMKAEAERWLEEFVSSLGAFFPGAPDARWAALKDYLTGQIEQYRATAEDLKDSPRPAARLNAIIAENQTTLHKMRELEAGQ